MNEKLVVSSPPYIHSPITTSRAVVYVCVALLPALITGIFLFGFHAFLLVILTIISCVIFEIAYDYFTARQIRINYETSVLTGMLLAASLAPGVPLWIPVIGAGFSIVIVKQLFGGMGFNILNPALAGRAFLMLCFPMYMINSLQKPLNGSLSGIDAISQATPLTILKTPGSHRGLQTVIEYFGSSHFLKTAMLGHFGGSIGETCKLALIIGGIFLLFYGIIDFRIVIGYLVTFITINLILPHRINPLFQLCTGGVLLAIFFMATDWVTTPLTKGGRWIFGIGCGFFTGIFRVLSPFPEGVTPAILLMNALTPLINKITTRSKRK